LTKSRWIHIEPTMDGTFLIEAGNWWHYLWEPLKHTEGKLSWKARYPGKLDTSKMLHFIYWIPFWRGLKNSFRWKVAALIYTEATAAIKRSWYQNLAWFQRQLGWWGKPVPVGIVGNWSTMMHKGRWDRKFTMGPEKVRLKSRKRNFQEWVLKVENNLWLHATNNKTIQLIKKSPGNGVILF
jgi:hypothetical protein